MKYSVTVDDLSPIISYQGQWREVIDESETLNYMGASYHSTSSNGSLAGLTFVGTSISVVGSKGSDHGKYAVTLDGSEELMDGFSTSNEYQIPLFIKQGLAYGRHTLQLKNLVEDPAKPWLYIDYMEFETGNDDNIANASYNVDDNNSTISYSPPQAWNTTVQNLSSYYGNTVHTTNYPGALMSTHFDGNAIYIFGAVGTDYGVISVTIDGNATTLVNCFASSFRPQTLLFYSNDFLSGRHSLTLEVPTNSPRRVDIDYLTVTRWSDNNGLGRSKAKTPIIAGTICGTLIILAWLSYLGHWYYRRRQKRKGTSPEMLKVSDTIALRTEKEKGSQGMTGIATKSREESGNLNGQEKNV
ncbi:hypothetical protein CPB86DRAFT_772332 [Serendipita vermifera]|nr:hypothetical protein CPB86DRAFT_772332 [Serendipita vermifera]